MSFIDNFSPVYVGSDRFRVTLSDATLKPTAGQAVIFLVDYTPADPDGGPVLPLRVIIQAPTVAGFFKRIYTRLIPSEIIYFPISGGDHLVTVGELGHNQFFGTLPFKVAGDTIQTPILGRG